MHTTNTTLVSTATMHHTNMITMTTTITNMASIATIPRTNMTMGIHTVMATITTMMTM